MIALEGVVAHGSLRQSSPHRLSSVWIGRLGRWIATRGWIHVLLLTALAGCLYPLVWMFIASVKTDEELGQGAVMPAVPVFRDHSPYVRDEPVVTRPDDVPAARFGAALPSLIEVTKPLAASTLPSPLPPLVDPDRWASSAATWLIDRTVARMPRDVWSQSGDVVLDKFRALLTPEAVAEAVSQQLSRLEVSALSLAAVDGRLFALASGANTASWRFESGRASLAPFDGALRVDYQFASSSDAPVVLVHDFDLPEGVDAADIHKIVLSLRSDDSWHQVDASLEVGGVRWVSTRPTYLAQNRAQSISFQLPSFDDTTLRARTWVPLRAAGPSAHQRSARLAVSLSPTSRAGAILAKVQRNYRRAIDSVPFLRYVGNSLLLVGLTTTGALFSSAFVAYAFARLQWPGRSVALVVLLSTMMVPPQVTMVPSFVVWKTLGWYNTLNPMWVPAWFGIAFFIFLMIQHMKTIPRELEEAARIDGLGIVQTWWYVILPQLKPTLAAIAVLSFLGAWNEFMGPLIYLRDQAKFPLSLGLFGMRIDQGAEWSMLMAANMLMTLPSIAVFFCFQRYFIEGLTVTGMKG